MWLRAIPERDSEHGGKNDVRVPLCLIPHTLSIEIKGISFRGTEVYRW